MYACEGRVYACVHVCACVSTCVHVCSLVDVFRACVLRFVYVNNTRVFVCVCVYV